MDHLQKLGAVLLTAYSFCIAYQLIYAAVGLFAREKVYPPSKKRRTFGIVIAARNEERVVGKLLESIARQDYDPSLLTVYVVADNCTDRTAAICRKWGARVYERFDPEHARKGYALEYLFERIRRDYGIGSVDAYLFFDADNLLKSDFITQIDRALDAGADMAVGYRNTKNFDTNFISAAYGLHFYESAVFMHRPRSFFRQSTHIAGTGYAVSSRLLEAGWHWTCLTEDTQLCLDAVARGVKIDYCEAAEFFDEQPYTVGVMLRQRLRWAKGRLACFFPMFPRLLRGMVKNRERRFSCYDMFFYILPKALFSALASLLYALTGLAADLTAGAALAAAPYAILANLPGLIRALALSWLRLTATGALVAVRERKRIRCSNGKLALYVLLWPFFDLLGLPISLAGLFMHVTWKPIRHDKDISIAQLERAGRQMQRRKAKAGP